MKKKILVIQGSDINKINYKTDTSVFLGLEAQRRKFDIFYYEPKHLSFKNGYIFAECFKIKIINKKDKTSIQKMKKINLNLSKIQILLIRNEPPFNQQYLNTTYLLEQISNKVKILNSPKGIRDVQEKLFSLKFVKFMPPTLVSENLYEIKAFFSRYKQIVVKPIEGYSGNDVKLIKKFSKNKINRYLKKYNHVIFQKYISKISKGDKRVFIINGRVKGAISRVPKKGSILSNMSKGAYARIININLNELKISKLIAKELKKNNIYFAGIDFINGKLIGDINVTSPTGLKTFYDLTGINLAKYFFDNI